MYKVTMGYVFDVDFNMLFSTLLNIYCIPRFNEVESVVYWFHVVRRSFRLSVRLWTKSCPLYIFPNTSRNHLIYAHFIEQ